MKCLLYFAVLQIAVLSTVLAETVLQDFVHESDGKSSSLPRLDTGDYRIKGEVSSLDDLPIYVVGTGCRCIVWNYDIFGFDAGRTRQLCDYFAEQGFMVVMPDYYRGRFKDPSRDSGVFEFLFETSNWTSLHSDWEKVKEFSTARGCKTFGAIGTCWGSYPVVRLSTLPDFSAGVSMHPSHSPIIEKLGENEEEIYSEIKCPQLLMPSMTDSPNVKLGGLAENVLGDNVKIREFNEMRHGWTTRGNLSDPAIDRDVHAAIEEAVSFFQQQL